MSTTKNRKRKPGAPRTKTLPKADQRLDIHHHLYELSDKAIRQTAYQLLNTLLDRCTLNLITQLSGVTRVTLYRWLEPNLPIDKINVRDAAWFIVMCETHPKLILLLSKPKATNPRLAKRMLEQEEREAATRKEEAN